MAGFSVLFFSSDLYCYAYILYFEKKITLKSSAQNLELKLSLIQDGCHLLLAEISKGKKKEEKAEIFL
jgi:hypothetical protein